MTKRNLKKLIKTTLSMDLSLTLLAEYTFTPPYTKSTLKTLLEEMFHEMPTFREEYEKVRQAYVTLEKLPKRWHTEFESKLIILSNYMRVSSAELNRIEFLWINEQIDQLAKDVKNSLEIILKKLSAKPLKNSNSCQINAY